MSPKNVWGKIVLFLKEHHQVALHVAWGDITNVELDDQSLTVKVEDGMLANLLSDGRREIENALRWQGLDLSFKVEILAKEISPQEQDIAKLQKLVGDYLIVKGEN